MDSKNIKDVLSGIDSIIAKLEKHFSVENDDRHHSPYDWDITEPHNELGEPQSPHGGTVGKRRMATALRSLAEKRGKSSIPKWLKLIELTSEQLNSLGEKHFGDKWAQALESVAGGEAGENKRMDEVPDSAAETEKDGPPSKEVLKAREVLKGIAREAGIAVKDIDDLSDAEVMNMLRKLRA